MKKLFSSVLALVMAFSLSAQAYQDYGLTYDETDQLNADFLQTLAYEVFQPLTNEYDMEVRLDVMLDTGAASAQEMGAALYSNPDYGYGATTNGACVTMTLLVDQDATGLDFVDYSIQAFGSAAEVLSPQELQAIEQQLAVYLTPDMWTGALDTDLRVFEAALNEYPDALTQAITAAPVVEEPEQEVAEEPESAGVQAAISGPFVFDEAGLLTQSEAEELEARAAAIAQTQGCGVYIATLDDYQAYGAEPYDAATAFYREHSFGVGSEKNGILLLLSMNDRDYALVAYGTAAHTAFTDYGKEVLSENFLDNFSEDDWYGGFSDYVSDCEEFLTLSAAGTPVDIGGSPAEEPEEELTFAENLAACAVLAFPVALIVALIICLVMKGQMKSARVQTAATEYVGPEGVDLQQRHDQYIHTTVTRVPLPKDDDHGGGTTIRAGGFSGRSGKF